MIRALLLAAFLTAQAGLPTAPAAPPPITQSTTVVDEADAASLLAALAKTRTYLAGVRKPTLSLLGQPIPIDRFRRSVDRLSELTRTAWNTPAFDAALKEEFEWITMPGTDGQGTVHFTGYHLPLLEAREKPDAVYRFPLYAVPGDMLDVPLGAFKPALSGQHLTARVKGAQVLPYFSRAEIDDGGALAGKQLELAWVADELARYSLMVQGSGLLHFPDGRVVNINYAGQNGLPYVSLGKGLVADGKIPADRISMPAIAAYFKAHPREMRGYLNRNPSYVFFRLSPDGPYGVDSIPLTPGRAIATDKSLFPSGAIAVIRYPRARFDAKGVLTGWETGSRLVVDQDTGGAIRGPGRIDIYWGGGEEAAQRAGTLNGNGRASYLLLKTE